MEITRQHILKACPTAYVNNLDAIVKQLNLLCSQYEINTVNRTAMFIAQCLHESGGFRYMKEIWGPTKWQIAYEGKATLGNTKPGDGKLFMGRGLIQLTGRNNYQKFSTWANDPTIVTDPGSVALPAYAVLSAIWFWTANGLSSFADANDIKGCTRRVNGTAMLGLDERTKYYEALKAAFAA